MDNGQWVVFQKRKNGEVNFTRGWEDYVRGFGDPEWEYWLGLERIHCLTAAVFRAELRVDLGDFEGNRKYAQYNFFSVNNALTNYRHWTTLEPTVAMQGINYMGVVAVVGTMMGWHSQHMTVIMIEVLSTVLRHTLLDGGTMTVTAQI